MANLILNPNFYIDLPQKKDKRSRIAIDNFIYLISAIQGKDDTEFLFECSKKTF